MATPLSITRSRARRGAIQALYQWQLAGDSTDNIRAQFRDRPGMVKVDWDYFDLLVEGVSNQHAELDAHIAPLLDRPMDQLDPVEKCILRMATYELCHCAEVPMRVCLNEAVELAHTFGAQDSHRYINGVLDPLAKQLRGNS
jgi:N utilization substance protein B